MMDDVIASPKSTFSAISMLLSGKRFLLPRPIHSEAHPICEAMKTGKYMIVDNTRCYRVATYEACYHRAMYSPIPPYLLVDPNSTRISSEVFHNCQDYCSIDGNNNIVGWVLQTIS